MDGSIRTLTQSYGTRLGQIPKTEYHAAGISDKHRLLLIRIRHLEAEGIPFILGFIEAQIHHENTRLKSN